MCGKKKWACYSISSRSRWTRNQPERNWTIAECLESIPEPAKEVAIILRAIRHTPLRLNTLIRLSDAFQEIGISWHALGLQWLQTWRQCRT